MAIDARLLLSEVNSFLSPTVTHIPRLSGERLCGFVFHPVPASRILIKMSAFERFGCTVLSEGMGRQTFGG